MTKEKIDGKVNEPVAICGQLPMIAEQQLSGQEEIAQLIMNIRGERLGIFHPTYHKPYVLRVPYINATTRICDIVNVVNLSGIWFAQSILSPLC